MPVYPTYKGVYRSIVFAIFLAIPFVIGQAQNTDKFQKQEVVYEREFNLGIKVHTHGYGLNFNFVKVPSVFSKRIWQIELQEIKHQKEVRRSNEVISSGISKSYIFGKQSNFYNLNLSYARQRVLSEKGRKSGVEISMLYKVGFSLGLAKPYYLVLIDSETNQEINARYTPENESDFLNPFRIFASSGFSFGWDEVKFYPGGVGKFGFLFDWADESQLVKGLEFGVMLNAYASRIPIIVETESTSNNFLFTNLYLSLILGRRW